MLKTADTACVYDSYEAQICHESVAIARTVACQMGQGLHLVTLGYDMYVKVKCNTREKHWPCARSLLLCVYLQADMDLWDMCTQVTQLHQDPEKPKAAL